MADMNDAFKMGLGALDVAAAEAERVTARFRESHAAEIAEGRKMLDAAVKRARADATKAHAKVKLAVSDAVKQQDLVEHKDLDELIAAVERLGAATSTIVSSTARNVKAKVKAQAARAKATRRPARKGAPKKAAAKKGAVVRKSARKAPAKKSRTPAKKTARKAVRR